MYTSSKKKRLFKQEEYLDTEGLKKILFPVLNKIYPPDVINILNTEELMLFGTPLFAYIFLLQKYDYLNCNGAFEELSMPERLYYLIYDRGAGNNTAFNNEETAKMLKTKINSYNDAVFAIIDCEQSRDEGRVGPAWDFEAFKPIASDIEKAYLNFRDIKSIEA